MNEMMEKRKRVLEVRRYYNTVIKPSLGLDDAHTDIEDPRVAEMIMDRFGVEIPPDTLHNMLIGDFTVSIERALEDLKTSGLFHLQYRALKVLLEDETPEVFFCAGCGVYFSTEVEHSEYDGHTFCSECMETEFSTCSECGELFHNSDIIVAQNGENYCHECAEQFLYYCNECGEYTTEDDMVWDENGYHHICSSCFGAYYYRCEECGSFIHYNDDYYEEDGYYYCENCYEDAVVIHSYNYQPAHLNFHGDGNRFLGVELEVDDGGECTYNAREIIDLIGSHHAYIKHDGSLNDGFEIVSHPATLDYHMREIDWEGVLQELKHLDYVSHDAGTCGLHVHLNRGGFGDTEEEQDLGIAKVLYFFERHWSKIVKFSRRTRSQLDEWAARYLDDDPTHPEDVLEYAKDDASRYRCVNLCNRSTVELRVFRGTLVYETFMATLQFADLMYDIAELSLEEVMDLTWDSFKEMGSKYKEFTSYMEKRGL